MRHARTHKLSGPTDEWPYCSFLYCDVVPLFKSLVQSISSCQINKIKTDFVSFEFAATCKDLAFLIHPIQYTPDFKNVFSTKLVTVMALNC